MLKKILYMVFIGVSLSSFLGANSTIEGRVVINLSGKQRMLTQKMSKEALLIIKGIDISNNRDSLEKTIALFDTTLHGLRDGDSKLHLPKTKEKKIIEQLDKGIKLWSLFRKFLDKVVEGKADKDTLKAIEIANMPLLKVMDRVVHLYEKKYKSDISPALAKTINLAGRERMLIQKMTKELLLIANNSQSDAYIKSLQKGGSLFQSKLSELMSDVDAIKDPKLLKRIKGVQQLWDEYQEAILNTELSASGLKLFNQKEKKIIQQMSEELVAVAQQIDAKRYQINLKETQELFDSTLRALINGDKKMGVIKPSNSKVKKQLERVQSLWQEYQPIITKVDISDRGLRKAMQINMPLLRAVDKAVKLYEIN
jgi:hypothetical protein